VNIENVKYYILIINLIVRAYNEIIVKYMIHAFSQQSLLIIFILYVGMKYVEHLEKSTNLYKLFCQISCGKRTPW
jgi:hypothetical protein